MGKVGRPKLNEGDVKRQLSICLTSQERAMVGKMADDMGVTISQLIAFLIRQSHESESYLLLREEMTQEEIEDLDNQRERVKYKTMLRSESAKNRNLSRRMGLDRGLTNVLVVKAQEDANLPGIFCDNMGQMWLIPFCMLHKLEIEQLKAYPCYESVMDCFADREVPYEQLCNFIDEHIDYRLTSEGEKSVLLRLAISYGATSNLPDDIDFEQFPEKDPFELPYLKDLTVRGQYPYLDYSERQKVLQDALTMALLAISQVEHQIRFEDSAVAAQVLLPEQGESLQPVKRGRGRPRKTQAALEVTKRRRFLQIRAESMLKKVHKLALYNNEPVNLPPEITHEAVKQENKLSQAFIQTVEELQDYLKRLTQSKSSLSTRYKPNSELSQITATYLSNVAPEFTAEVTQRQGLFNNLSGSESVSLDSLTQDADLLSSQQSANLTKLERSDSMKTSLEAMDDDKAVEADKVTASAEGDQKSAYMLKPQTLKDSLASRLDAKEGVADKEGEACEGAGAVQEVDNTKEVQGLFELFSQLNQEYQTELKEIERKKQQLSRPALKRKVIIPDTSLKSTSNLENDNKSKVD